MQSINHAFDFSLESNSEIYVLSRSAFFAEKKDDSKDDGFDCAGTVGSAGTLGGTFGTFGTFGCCC